MWGTGPIGEFTLYQGRMPGPDVNSGASMMNTMKTTMLLAAMTAIFMGFGYLIGGGFGTVVALIVAAAMNLFSFWNADKVVLRMHRAVEADEHSAPELFDIVRQLAERAGLPMPKVYIIDNPQPNAFATGRNPQNAAVAATTGLLEQLNPEEVAGVMAHELAHIDNRDTLTMTVTATIAGAISMLANFALFFGGGRNNNSPFGFIGLLLAAITAPFAAMLVQMAISRTREYSADRRGSEISGNPMWLASALAKIARAAGRMPMITAERNPATAHLFIINPLSGERMDNLFSTHPGTENRIAALQDMAGQATGGTPEAARYRQDQADDAPAPTPKAKGPWSQDGGQAPPRSSGSSGGPWG